MGWLLLFLHVFFFHFPSFSCFNFLCHQDESSALLQFKSSFTIDTYSYYDEPIPMKTRTWKNGSDCCSWHGVTCDTVSGHVIGLNLGGERLSGILHPNSTLFHLSHLQTLNLSSNDFSHSHFHSKFGDFISLTHLDLSSSFFQGDVPPQISHLSKLISLHLSVTDLIWKESTLKRLVQNATNLRELFLDNTDMSSIKINSLDLLFNHSSSLVTLDLASTRLSGNFQKNATNLIWKESTLKRLVQNATNLRELFLDYTNMSSIRLNSLDLLFNHSSSLVTLNLGNTLLRGNFKHSIFCIPSIHELYMSHNDDLRGQLPELSCSNFLRILDFSVNQFEGPIPPSLSNLTFLTSLNLYSNYLNGSIPSSLLNLPCLTFLDLSENGLSGQIPNVFHQSNQFQELHLSDNKIEGELPISLSNLQHLISLDLSFNSLNGQIPDVFGGITKLQELNLDSNNFEGHIPSSLFNLNQLLTLNCHGNKLVGPLIDKISGFQKLSYLNLENNLLNGTIPSSLLSLPCLKSLSLTNNRFTGHISAISSYLLEELYLCNNKLQGNIPKSIFNLSNLTTLCLSSNNLSGVANFQHFSKLQNLRYLSLSHNSQLSISFESNASCYFSQLTDLDLSSLSLIGFHNLSRTLPSLSYLDLSNNKLNGKVPSWLLEKIDLFGFLNLSQNLFTSIDLIPTRSYKLGYLDLSSNLLQGELSASICNMSSLKILNLAHNKLTGTIPQCLVSLSYLLVLDLQMNKFYGNFPNMFSKDCRLLTLNVYGNHLEDCLPKTLSHCKTLEVLNLGNNRIEDNFPNWLQTLESLKVLVLRDNKFHGSISNLRINCSFPNLIIFDISGNNFSGSLPKAYFKKFEAMKDEDASFSYMAELLYNSYSRTSSSPYYYYSVTMTIKGINSTLEKISRKFAIIDMSRNKFEGEISNVVGELQALKGLNLSHNRLSGIIPRSMRNLTNLESLDLSSNMITGVIPAELSDLNFLEFLNLSNNHLEGEIPHGKQFNTFSNDSYEGNLGLCGFPLSKTCAPEQKSPPSPNKLWSEEKFGFGWKPVAIGYGCGFVFGIGLGYCMFLVGKPRWLVIIFGGKPKRRVKRRTRVRRTNGSAMNQMIQMS